MSHIEIRMRYGYAEDFDDQIARFHFLFQQLQSLCFFPAPAELRAETDIIIY